MSGAVIGEDSRIYKAIVGPGAKIGRKCRLGLDEEDKYKSKYCSGGVSLVGADVTIADGSAVGRNSMITENIKGGKR